MRKLFRKVEWKSTIITGAVAAVLFAVSVFIYIWYARYDQSWIVYVGSFAFMAVIYYHILHDSKIRGNNESTVTLVFNSHLSTIIGVLISCILSFILLMIMIPGYPAMDGPKDYLEGEPGNMLQDRTDGLSFIIFLSATVINFSVGSFCGIVVPFTIKRNQMGEKKDPAPLHQSGRR